MVRDTAVIHVSVDVHEGLFGHCMQWHTNRTNRRRRLCGCYGQISMATPLACSDGPAGTLEEAVQIHEIYLEYILPSLWAVMPWSKLLMPGPVPLERKGLNPTPCTTLCRRGGSRIGQYCWHNGGRRRCRVGRGARSRADG